MGRINKPLLVQAEHVIFYRYVPVVGFVPFKHVGTYTYNNIPRISRICKVIVAYDNVVYGTRFKPVVAVARKVQSAAHIEERTVFYNRLSPRSGQKAAGTVEPRNTAVDVKFGHTRKILTGKALVKVGCLLVKFKHNVIF